MAVKIFIILGLPGSGKSIVLYLFWELAALISTFQLILQVILQILRDPAWNAVGTLVSLASVGLALRKSREIHPLQPPLLQRKSLKRSRRRKRPRRKKRRR